MSLPELWLDSDRGLGVREEFQTIDVVDLNNLGAATIEKMVLSEKILSKSLDQPTSFRNVKALYMPEADMAPAISVNDLLFVDTGCESVDKTGVYIITRSKHVFVRRIRRLLTGKLRISTDSEPDSIEADDGEFRIAGRVVGMLRFSQP
jgi:hypothetical protein